MIERDKALNSPDFPPFHEREQLSLFDPIVIRLTKGCVTKIDTIDADLTNFRWCVTEGRGHVSVMRKERNTTGYKKVFMHRVILARMLNRPLTHGEMTDHIDGDPLNNCRSNLRLATSAENAQNRKRPGNNTSGYKGVSYHKVQHKWSAQIKFGGRLHYLGMFNTPEEASEAYKREASMQFGQFARFE